MWAGSGTVTANRAYLAKRSNFQAPNAGYHFGQGNSGAGRFEIGDGTDRIQVVSTTIIPDEAPDYVHMVGTYDGSSVDEGMRMYINGILEGIGSANTLSASTLNAQVLTLGAMSTGSSAFIGQVDNAALWDFELSAEAVEALFNEGAGLVIME